MCSQVNENGTWFKRCRPSFSSSDFYRILYIMYRCFYVQIYYIAIYVFNIYIYLYKIRSYSHSGAASSTLALIAHSWHISVPASHDGTIWRRRWATRISGLWSCEGFGREDFTAGGGDEYDDNPATTGSSSVA